MPNWRNALLPELDSFVAADDAASPR